MCISSAIENRLYSITHLRFSRGENGICNGTQGIMVIVRFDQVLSILELNKSILLYATIFFEVFTIRKT